MSQILRKIARRVQLMISTGVLRLVNSDAHAQRLQVGLLFGENLDHVELREPYGFTAHPHPGSEVLVGCIGGERAHTVAICAGGRMYRLKGLAEGEVALYDDLGQAVELRRDGIHVTAPTVTVHGDAVVMGDVEVSGDSQVDGDGTVSGKVSALGDVEGLLLGAPISFSTIRAAFNAHTHTETGVTTTPPGVQV